MHKAVAIIGALVGLAVLGSLAWTVGRLAHEYLDPMLVPATSTPLPTLTPTFTSTSTPPPTPAPTLTPTLRPTSTPAPTSTPTPAW